jgi:hypothetical protein
MLAEFFPRVNVRDVDLDGRDTDRSDRIPDRVRRMGVRAAVHDDRVRPVLGQLDQRDQLALVVGLGAP